MPQGRRKTPFSGKQKKLQLIEKKQSKVLQKNLIRRVVNDDTDDTEISEDMVAGTSSVVENIQKINLQPQKDPRSKSNRYVLQFHRETNKELKEAREEARKPFKLLTGEDLEIGDEYFEGYNFPKRPKWTYEMSKEQVDANENKYFFKYITMIEKMHYDDMKMLSYCELNLETWRQLWRVLEISDIILTIVDVRMPSLMFPPSLYDFVVNELGKQMILVMNKIDLVDAPIVLAWKKYFEEKYPQIRIVLFTSYPSYNLRGYMENTSGLKIRRRRGRMRMTVEGANQIYKACKDVVGDAVDLSSWEKKILEESQALNQNVDTDEPEQLVTEGTHEAEKLFEFEEHVKYKDGILTIGCVGFPNVGKSSLMNGIMGKKVVSVSRTPGHTKHFQTIFLTKTVRLCDCPGLVFPSCTPRKLQVLLGSYPIAQLREPYGSIKYLAERVDLSKLLNIQHPEGEGNEWSAIDICDGWALKRGFLTAKTARPDTYRAANSILRMALDGKITLSLAPKGYTENAQLFRNHPELETVLKTQALGKTNPYKDTKEDFWSESEEEYSAEGKAPHTEGEQPNAGSDETHESEDESASAPAVSNPFDLLVDSED